MTKYHLMLSFNEYGAIQNSVRLLALKFVSFILLG